jgi:diguanylate cyclase (GGDEF)-like protein
MANGQLLLDSVINSVIKEVNDMESRFRLKLIVTMIAFAMSISVILAAIDHNRLKSQTIQNQQVLMQKSEEMVITSIDTIEKAYYLFGEQMAASMKEATSELMLLYEKQPDFDQWSFNELKKEYGYDVYIINKDNVITHSSMESDIGLDFKSCCKSLAKTLDARRISGQFYPDGMDIEQETGVVKKYSYQGTPDGQFIIQLGNNLQEGAIFQQFNFFTAIDNLTLRDPLISHIYILNTAGNALGYSTDSFKLLEEHYKAFKHTLDTKETTERPGEWNGKKVSYRNIYYKSKYDTGTTTERKVIQVIYNDEDLQNLLADNRKAFVFQLGTVLFVTIILSLFISKAVARPMHLAFHDSLTGLKNRAAFDEAMIRTLSSQQTTTALIMMDVDNFKEVNDKLGHDTGDQLLKCVAEGMHKAARKGDISARLGGDEFIMILPETSAADAMQMAERLIDSITALTTSNRELSDQPVTISVGIAVSPIHGQDAETLIKHADKALYSSKKRGKNQYQVYNA